MVDTQSVMRSLGLNLRSICLIAFVVGAVTGGNMRLNREAPPLGYDVYYSKLGFSILYRKPFGASEYGFPDFVSGATDVSGVFQSAGWWDSIYYSLLVIWTTEASTPDLEAVMDQFYALLADPTQRGLNCTIDSKGPLASSEKDGNEMLYQTFTFNQHELEFIATCGVWYESWSSLHANRVYIFVYITLPEAATQQQVLERFEWYLDSFVSH